MPESKYTVGLLIASCVVLVVAIVVTYIEIAEYGEPPPTRTVAPLETGPAVGAPEEGVEDVGGAPEDVPEEIPEEGGEELPEEGAEAPEDFF